MLVKECMGVVKVTSPLRLEVDMGSVLESELAQKWRYGALEACIC